MTNPADPIGLPLHERRVLVEAASLRKKLDRLTVFMRPHNQVWEDLPFDERALLVRQHVGMKIYLDALSLRVANFRRRYLESYGEEAWNSVYAHFTASAED